MSKTTNWADPDFPIDELYEISKHTWGNSFTKSAENRLITDLNERLTSIEKRVESIEVSFKELLRHLKIVPRESKYNV